jgi:hypothetical protein
MKWIRNFLGKLLSHPAWTGIGTIVALLALFISFNQQSSTTNTSSESGQKVSSKVIDFPASQPRAEADTGLEKRVALVVGNSEYDKLPNLARTDTSAREFARFLESANFDVQLLLNSTRREMEQAFGQFVQSMGKDTTASLFYFSGYTVSVMDRNYLMPIDAEAGTERDVVFSSISFDWALEQQGRTPKLVSFVILDSAPLATTSNSSKGTGGRGLSRPDIGREKDTIIAFSDISDGTASDSKENGGYFTHSLIDVLSRPGLPAIEAFRIASQSVRHGTGGRQSPSFVMSASSDAISNFVFTEHGITGEKNLTRPSRKEQKRGQYPYRVCISILPLGCPPPPPI